MNEDFSAEALDILERAQENKDGRQLYTLVHPKWLAFDIDGHQTLKKPAASEKSDLSGTIDFCGIKTEMLIYRSSSDGDWSIHYIDLAGNKCVHGEKYSTDEDAFEAFVDSLSGNKLENFVLEKNWTIDIF